MEKHPSPRERGRSLVWSRTSACHNINWSNYREHLSKKYSKQYTSLLYSYAVKYCEYLQNTAKISELPTSIKSNVDRSIDRSIDRLKALIALSKYLGIYQEFTQRFKNHGIKWTAPNSFSSFLNIFNDSHSTLIQWFKDASAVLDDNERLFLRFVLLSGLRKEEAIKSFNMIIKLCNENRLNEYYDVELSVIEHFRFPEDFLRNTKNAFITVISKDFIDQIGSSRSISYNTLRKHLTRHRLKLRIKELRSYNNSYLRKHGVLSEMVDILAGRVPKTVFARHYLKESIKNLSDQVLPIQNDLLSSIS